MNTVNEFGYAEEPKELIQMCFECEKIDCVGNGGCAEYRKLKRKLMGEAEPEPIAANPVIVPEKPDPEDVVTVHRVIEFDLAPKEADPNALQYFNAAIAALAEINKFGNGFMFDVADMLDRLVADREKNFSYMIDWDMVAFSHRLKEAPDETTE